MRRKIMAIASAATLAVSLAACTSSDTNNKNSGANGSTVGTGSLVDDCTAVVVGTSSEKVNLMDELGQAFKESSEASKLDNCVTVYPINVPSGKGSEILSAQPTEWPELSKDFYPTVWSPASSVWTERVAASGAGNYIAESESFTKTPVVFGVPETMARALGYPKKQISIKTIEGMVRDPKGWGSVGKPIWGSFKIAKTNPNTSTTGLNIILMQSYANAGKSKNLTVADVEAAKSFNQTFESGAIHYGDTTGNVLKTLYKKAAGQSQGSDYVSAVALEETSLYNYNLGNPDSHTVQPGETLTPPAEKLVAVYPEEGSVWSDNPAAVLNAPWVSGDQKTASTAFVKFLQTKTAQEILPKYGFRPLDKSVDMSKHLNSDTGIDPKQPAKTLAQPDASVVSAAISQWAEVRKPSAVLELIDISGSMEESIGNGKTRLQGAVEGASNTLENFRSNDKIGIWAFTTDIESEHGANVSPVREFSPLGSGRETLKDSISDLLYANKGGTPLYDSIATAYDYMLKQAEPGRINAIVVLSDGEDTNSNMSLDSLLVQLNTTVKEGAASNPVRIFTIAYGAEADKSILSRISEATGGQSFDASDPTKINETFAQVMNNF